MSKRFQILLGVSIIVILVLIVGGGVGYIQYQEAKVQSWRTIGLEAYDEELWGHSKSHLRGYLAKYPDDVEALEVYAKACERILSTRHLTVRDAGNAYFQLAGLEEDNAQYIAKVIECDLRRRAWADLEYHAEYFLQDTPDDLELRFYHALALERTGQFEQALESYEVQLEDGAVRLDIFTNMARILFDRGFDDQAQEVFTLAIELGADPDGVSARRAHYLLNTGNTTGAKDELKKYEGSGNDTPLEVDLVAIRVADFFKDWDAMLAGGLRVLAALPADSHLSNLRDAYTSTTVAYQQLSETSKAIQQLEEMDAGVRADNPEFYVILAELLIAEDRIEEANTYILDLLQIHPQMKSYTSYLDARILLTEGNASRAASKLSVVVDANPAFRQAQFYLVAASLEMGDRGTARTRLESYLFNHPDDVDAQSLFEREFGAAKSLQAVTNDIQALLKDENASPMELARTANDFYRKTSRLGLTEDSKKVVIAILERAISIDPIYPTSYLLLAEVHSNAGEISEAHKAIERAELAGVAAEEMRLVRAAVAVAEGDIEAAQDIYKEQITSVNLTANDAIRWSTFFIRRVGLDFGITMLELAIEDSPPENRLGLQTDQVQLISEYGEMTDAIALLDELDADDERTPEEQELLFLKRESLIRTMIGQGPQRNPVLAQKLAEAHLESHEGYVSAQLLLARVILNQEVPDVARARELTDPLLVANPDNLDAIMASADVAKREGNYQLAQELAERAATSPQADADTQTFLASLYLRQSRPQNAIEVLESALARDGEHIGALAMLIEAHASAKQYALAEATVNHLESLVSIDPNWVQQINLMRARLAMQQGNNLEEAEALLRAQFEAEPDTLRSANDLARVLARQAKTRDGETLLQEFAAKHASDPSAWVALGHYYLTGYENPKLAKASTAMTQALISDRNHLPALLLQMQIAMRSDRGTQALALCNRYLSLDPSNVQVLYHGARLTANSGNLNEALAKISRAVEINTDLENLLLRANILIRRGDFSDALRDLDSAVERYAPDNADVYLTFAEAYLGLNDKERAHDYYQRASRGSVATELPSAQRKRLDEQLSGYVSPS